MSATNCLTLFMYQIKGKYFCTAVKQNLKRMYLGDFTKCIRFFDTRARVTRKE